MGSRFRFRSLRCQSWTETDVSCQSVKAVPVQSSSSVFRHVPFRACNCCLQLQLSCAGVSVAVRCRHQPDSQSFVHHLDFLFIVVY